MDEKTSRPSFRPAQVITEADALRAFSSGAAEEIRLTLIDGSRCLSDEWILPHAVAFLRHHHPGVRWAAAFALGQVRRRVETLLVQGAFDETEDEEHPVKLLFRVTSSDPDEAVRDMAATALGDMVGDFVDAIRRRS